MSEPFDDGPGLAQVGLDMADTRVVLDWAVGIGRMWSESAAVPVVSLRLNSVTGDELGGWLQDRSGHPVDTASLLLEPELVLGLVDALRAAYDELVVRGQL